MTEHNLASEHHLASATEPGAATAAAATSRRTVLTGAAALAAVGFVPGAAAAAPRVRSPRHARVTVLGTTDLHGNVFNWDYFKNTEYDDSKHNDIGLAKIATLVKAIREDRGVSSTLMIDAGDTIQGTPLAYYYAKVDPINGGAGSPVHPMAAAMNEIGYDAAALGNHEFNYGIDVLRTWQSQLEFPLLAANALDAASGLPAFEPYVIKKVHVHGERPVKVGILGLTNPGIAIWDRANVEGRMTFPGLVEQAAKYVPEMKRRGADIVIVSAHSGSKPSSSYGDALPYPENASSQVAEQVPGIDAILVGHAHEEIPEKWVTNAKTGKQVLLTEPLKWGMRLAVLTIDVERTRTGWRLEKIGSQLLDANTVDEDRQVVKTLTDQHEKVVSYVNSVIGSCTTAMSAQRAVVEDVAAIDFVNYVQADAVRSALKGTADEALPVLSIAAPFNRDAAIPAGQVTVRDVAGLYIFDNTLLAVKVTGAQVRDYLEFSAQYFQQVDGSRSYAIDELIRATTATAPNGTPDYNYDIVAGLDKRLTYDIDVSRPAGDRIRNLRYEGADLDPAQEFALAINNYRQSGGGNYPHVKTAPVLYNRQAEIRQLLIDWVIAQQTIDPATFSTDDWQLVRGDGTPIQIS
ncbi:bifunctional metallophosphatase/5'-nucleotidase [Nocardioides mesophilus]|uniref:5'-nucleotidase C-terminal domain-containing protein n=1 Tax=Nocardioides mesophilus TaxID=433659 RepID=A0A7G9RD30_9ACTN|nr:5'-nucleotidase C-terminal domain-containing protein [Nocardioides mesophilus]QNN53505.1 5'-nucleotidase C-terminal domain-containing protein [Nocardioides mesophilus]